MRARRWVEMPDLEAVRVFSAVAELRSFRGAALALRLPRSTVSRRLAALETALGTRLLQRTTRQVSLTEAGELFLARVEPALTSVGDAARAIVDSRAEPRGLVRLTATPAMAETISGILLPLLGEHPELRVELDFTDRQVDLVAEGCDIALRAGALPDSSLVARPLGHGQSGYFASPAYLRRRRPRSPRELTRHDCIVFSGSPRGPRWLFQVGRRRVEVTVKKRLVANSLAVVRLAAVAGHGIAWIPETVARDDVAAGRLVPVLRAVWPPPVPVQLVYPSARHLAPQVRAVIDRLLAEMPPSGR